MSTNLTKLKNDVKKIFFKSIKITEVKKNGKEVISDAD